MKTTINFNQFSEGLGSESSFSYEGKRVLFEYLENSEHRTGEEIEFEPKVILDMFVEMNIDELIQNHKELAEKCTAYFMENPSAEQWTEIHTIAKSFLEHKTTLCGVSENNTYIFHSFYKEN